MKEIEKSSRDRNFHAFELLVPGANYELYQRTLFGEPGESGRLFLTIGVNEYGELETSLESIRPALGGYWSEKKYGRPDYCPSATRVHQRKIAETGVSINLIYFDSVEAAVMAGFTPCGNCWLKGESGLVHWQEYLAVCRKLGVEPMPTPKRFGE